MKVEIICFTTRGCELARRISKVLDDCECGLYSKTGSDTKGLDHVPGLLRDWTGAAFRASDAIVFVGAVGIAVRSVAPFIRNKAVDPAVVSVDEMGLFAISLLSGHIGGCNHLTRRIAEGIGATPVITTATDMNGKFSVDSFAAERNMHISSLHVAKDVSSRILAGGFVGISSEFPVEGGIPPELTPADSGDLGISISKRREHSPFDRTLRLIPRCHVLGVGCRRGTPVQGIEALIQDVLTEEDVSPRSVRAVASIDLKKDERGLLELCEKHRIPSVFFTPDELNALPDIGYSGSDFVRSATGVDCVCERAAIAASGGGALIRRKTGRNGVTVAMVREDVVIDLQEP